MNKLWRKFRLWGYKKLMPILMSMSIELFKKGTLKQRLKVLQILNSRMKDAIWEEYSDDEELRKLRLTLIGTVLGLALCIEKSLKNENVNNT